MTSEGSPAPSSAQSRATHTAGLVRHERWRRTVGLLLIFITVILWTASNFLASTQTLFADNTYSKPFLVTYVNTSCFVLPLLPMLLRQAWRDPASVRAFISSARRSIRRRSSYTSLAQQDPAEEPAGHKPNSPLLRAPSPSYDHAANTTPPAVSYPSPRLTLAQTLRLALEFCILWYLANYFAAACLEYTTVASSTILTSTSSIFTLLFGIVARVERFTIRKLLAVLASLAGIAMISSIDLSGRSDEGRGSFPHKSPREIGTGDAMAVLSAVLYGMYAVRMKARMHDESSVDMPLFFGLVGLLNTLLLWPGFFILHWSGIEPFAFFPDKRVAAIIAINALSSLVADFTWAYALLLTSPIIVTLGLTTTIPLSLIGQLVLNHQSAGLVYWLAAAVVVASFVAVNSDEHVAETHGVADTAHDSEAGPAETAGEEA
ncbi:hypothetical protein ANO11243_070640 [Dothideomycetidae sp. 11243]|nr:hypothetical protein ANO11243_070640 [fungal sp. No.11243]